MFPLQIDVYDIFYPFPDLKTFCSFFEYQPFFRILKKGEVSRIKRTL